MVDDMERVVQAVAQKLGNVTIVRKGERDIVSDGISGTF